ncbi:universal stress protein [Lentzea atacamensis]|uniref:universal stress protein n=1 Tax=Lentzea atacamensis TaxID=531938 RepID=UPI000DD46E51
MPRTESGKRTVVVGVDGALAARSAALWAADEASSRECELLLVHVVRDRCRSSSSPRCRHRCPRPRASRRRVHTPRTN